MSPNPLSLYAFLTRRMLFLLVAIFSLVLGCPGVLTASSGGIALENELIGVKIDTSTGKVTSIFNKQTGKEYWLADDTEIATVFIDHRTTSMWEAVPRRSVRLGSPTSWDRTQGAEGESLRLTFFDETYSITTILSLTIGHDEFLT